MTTLAVLLKTVGGLYTFNRSQNVCATFSYNPGPVLCPTYGEFGQSPKPVSLPPPLPPPHSWYYHSAGQVLSQGLKGLGLPWKRVLSHDKDFPVFTEKAGNGSQNMGICKLASVLYVCKIQTQVFQGEVYFGVFSFICKIN